MSSVLERGIARLQGKGSKSSRDLLSLDKPREFPPQAQDYEILDDCGRGVSATVHRALCKPLNEVVAIKKMNLDSLNCNLEEIIHEAQTMKNYHHPNVLPLWCSFVHGSDLWMVMPFISGGSVLHVMKYAHPDGLDEVVIATIMRDVLRALEYVHKQGGIHRDVKAGNILLDKDGHVFLADFGVAANTERTGSWGHEAVVRKTFVGTPCWMAPEVMEESSGYDSSADIWSFGITLLEMAHGHAPFAKFPPMKVLLMTLHNPPPTLDDKGKKHFSKSMRDLVTRCLQKDPRLRPTATQLLEHKFFKQARDDEFLARYLIQGLPPLGERVADIRQGKAATNARDNDVNFERSQDEYMKGISTWNFDVAALKAAAANEPDFEDEPMLPTIAEADEAGEGTLSGMIAHQAQQYVRSHSMANGETVLSRSPPPGASNNNSVFASLQGQQQLLLNTSAGSLPVVDLAPTPTGPASSPPPLITTQPTVPSPVQPAEGITLVPPEKPPSHTGQDSTALSSPGNISPSGLSREGSVQGPLNTLASTPTANKQKMKQQGRFQIYEPGSEPPPMSPPQAPAPAQSADAGRVAPTMQQLSDSVRISEDGARRIEPQESVFDTDTITGSTGEPKKKGRFLVVEQQSLSKASSSVALAQAGKEAVAAGASLGKPPTAPSTGGAAGTVAAAALLPRLQEILDHATAHQQGIQKLVSALQEAERGKTPALLNRTLSTRALFSEYGTRVTSDGIAMDSASGELDAARQRIAELENEVARLRVRNQQVEAQLHALNGDAARRAALVSAPGTDTPGSAAGNVHGLSPSDGTSPRETKDSEPAVGV